MLGVPVVPIRDRNLSRIDNRIRRRSRTDGGARELHGSGRASRVRALVTDWMCRQWWTPVRRKLGRKSEANQNAGELPDRRQPEPPGRAHQGL